MPQDKFLLFLESLTTQENKALIEAVTEGYKSILETNVGKFLAGEKEKDIASRIDRSIDRLNNQLDKSGLESVLPQHDKLIEFISENINELDEETYKLIEKTYMKMLKYVKGKFPVGGDILIDMEEQIDFILNNLRKLVI